MTPEEANANLLQKRRMNGAQRPASATTEPIESALGRLKVLPDAEADRERAKPVLDGENRPDRLLKLSGLPTRHREAVALQRFGRWERSFQTIKAKVATGFTIALIGHRGCGKTQIAVEVAKHVIGQGKPVLFASITKFFSDIKSTFRDKAQETELQVMQRYCRPKLLILDELNQRSESDWENRLMFDLLNDRYNEVRDTLLISNHTPETFEKDMGPSLVSRITETGGVIVCNWESFRK